MLDCWYIRNDCKHDTSGDPIARIKEKTIEELLWIVKNYNNLIPPELQNINIQDLGGQSKENLKIMLEQLHKVIKKN
jgi:hypothetical protein